MSRSIERCAVIALTSLAALLLSPAAFATDPPDSRLNPVSGAIETTDSTSVNGNYEIRHVTNFGQGQNLLVVNLTSNAADNLGPRLAISASTGDAWVVWWRDASTDQVLFRRRAYSTGVWSAERVLSGSGQGSRKSRVAHDGTRAWAAYEADGPGGGRSIIVMCIPDDPDPIPPAMALGTTGYGGELDLTLQAETGHLWSTWVDSSSQVGWAKFDYATATWSSAGYEPYASDSVAAARGRIRTTVLGN